MERLTPICPYRLGHDTREACCLEAAAFTEDCLRVKGNLRLESSRKHRMERAIEWLVRFVLTWASLGVIVERVIEELEGSSPRP